MDNQNLIRESVPERIFDANNNLIKRSVLEKIFDVFNLSFLTIVTLICLFPFYYIFIYSISDPARAHTITLLPIGVTIDNYINILQLPGLFNSAIVSVSRTVIGSSLTVFCCALFGYVLTKDKLPCRKIIYRYLVATMYLGAGLIPYYLTIRAYGLPNTFWVYVIPTAVSAFNVVLIKTYIEQLPASLEESARIDGAGYLNIFFKIIVPLSMPIIATIFVFAAVFQWNSFFDNFLFVREDSLRTLQYTLFLYLRRAEVVTADIDSLRELATRPTPQAVRMTITMIVTFPVLFVYPFAQRYFVKGIMIGAIKG